MKIQILIRVGKRALFYFLFFEKKELVLFSCLGVNSHRFGRVKQESKIPLHGSFVTAIKTKQKTKITSTKLNTMTFSFLPSQPIFIHQTKIK